MNERVLSTPTNGCLNDRFVGELHRLIAISNAEGASDHKAHGTIDARFQCACLQYPAAHWTEDSAARASA